MKRIIVTDNGGVINIHTDGLAEPTDILKLLNVAGMVVLTQMKPEEQSPIQVVNAPFFKAGSGNGAGG